MKSMYPIFGLGLMQALKSIRSGSFSRKNVFTEDRLVTGSTFLSDELKSANDGLKNGDINGVEICGDSFKLLHLLENKSINTVITSPPYYQKRKYSESSSEFGLEGDRSSYVDGMVKMFTDLKPKLKDDGVIVVNIDASARRKTETVRGIPEEFVYKMEQAGFYKKFNLIWEKSNFGNWSSVSTPGKNFEYIYGFVKKESKPPINFNQLLIPTKSGDGWKVSADTFSENTVQHGKWKASDTERFMIRFPEQMSVAMHLNQTGFKHPAPINQRVAWRLIQYFSSPGDVILDPFSGAGTINIVAKMLGRKAIGFELNLVHSMVAVVGEDFGSGNSIDKIHQGFKIAGKPRHKNYPGAQGILDGAKHPKPVSSYDPNKTIWINASTFK